MCESFYLSFHFIKEWNVLGIVWYPKVGLEFLFLQSSGLGKRFEKLSAKYTNLKVQKLYAPIFVVAKKIWFISDQDYYVPTHYSSAYLNPFNKRMKWADFFWVFPKFAKERFKTYFGSKRFLGGPWFDSKLQRILKKL